MAGVVGGVWMQVPETPAGTPAAPDADVPVAAVPVAFVAAVVPDEPLDPQAVIAMRPPARRTAARLRWVHVVMRRRVPVADDGYAGFGSHVRPGTDDAPDEDLGGLPVMPSVCDPSLTMTDLGHTALGAWSGGRFMHFGLPLDEERYLELVRPDDVIRTVITADVYGTGEADRMVGRAIAGLPRDSYRLVAAIGHDFTHGERDGAKGYPRFTDPRLRSADHYADYLQRACEESLERCGVDHFDLLMLHNPDRIGYSSPVVWEQGMARLREQGLATSLGLAPGPANGFTLDILRCLERFGELIEWSMIILNPFEPWPGRLVLPAMSDYDVKVLARVVDYGGVFHDDLPDEGALAPLDHRAFRPAGWVAQGRARLDLLRAISDRHGLTPLQLACQWTLAQPAVACVVPTLIQEPGTSAKPVETKRAELAAVPTMTLLTRDEIATITEVGENAGCMALKGGSPVHAGDEVADAWPLDDALRRLAERWNIVPDRDLVELHSAE